MDRGRDGAVTTGLLDAVGLAADPEFVTGMVSFLAQDAEGRIASAVSTSGWAWKYPGRLGDSPVIGVGNYADDRYGAAACMGWGELAIRTSTARSIVAGLQRRQSLIDACRDAFADLDTLGEPPAEPVLHGVAIDARGITTSRARDYLAWEEGMDHFTKRPCHPIHRAGL